MVSVWAVTGLTAVRIMVVGPTDVPAVVVRPAAVSAVAVGPAAVLQIVNAGPPPGETRRATATAVVVAAMEVAAVMMGRR